MWNHCSLTGHCNHSLSSSVYHSPHAEHSLSLLLDFSRPETASIALLYHRVWKASWSTAVWKNSILQSSLSLICRRNLWIESISGMDGAFRFNYFIRSRQVHSNKRWHKLHGSIRKFFGCMDHFKVYGLTLLFGKLRFWWFRPRHP